jgi:hypothetical protein
MKPLNHGNSLAGTGEDGDDGGSTGALGEYASEALGRALSERGGFGIAAGIVKELSPAVYQNGTRPVIGNLHVDTALKTRK